MAKQKQIHAVVPGAAAVIVQQGKILDYIDGLTQRKETPEEYIRRPGGRGQLPTRGSQLR